MRPARRCIVVAAGLLLLASRATAQTDPPAASPVAASAPAADDGLKVHAFLSTSYVFNVNRPPSGTNGLRVFDFTDGSFVLDGAQVIAEKTVSAAGDAGFRVSLVTGSSIPKVSAASGLFRDPSTGKAQDVDLQQAYASYMLGSHVRLDAGKFVTPLGLEVIEGWDGANDNASRSFLFGYAIPFTHTGVRISANGPKASALVMVVNGWDNAVDNNRGKTVAGQLSLTPTPAVSLTVTAITGPERPADDHHLRTVYDLVWTWKLGDLSSVSLNADDGRESGAAPDGGLATWRGAAAYTRIGFSKTFALCLRGEVFEDPQGVRTGASQRLAEFTLTPEVRLSPQAIIRADLRVDRSSRSIFETRTGSTRTQPTAQLNLVVLF